MIMNLRPTQIAALNTVVEELEQRFPDEAVQQEIVDTITDVLGSPDGEAERQAMTDSAKDARVREMGDEQEVVESARGMEVDEA